LLNKPHFNRNFFREADASDKIAFFNTLLENGDLTPEIASALIHDIHHDLSNLKVPEPGLLRRYIAVQQALQTKFPIIYDEVLKKYQPKVDHIIQNKTNIADAEFQKKPQSTFSRVVKYLLLRILTIAITIFLGVFITVVLANQGGQVDRSVRSEILDILYKKYPDWRWGYAPPAVGESAIEKEQWNLEEKAGLHLPWLPKHILLTFRALGLNWNEEISINIPPGSSYPSHHARDIVLADLPHTLLLVGTSYLLLFMIGIPLSLLLFRKEGKFVDRLVSILAPISSISSWVIGVILILILAVYFHLLPVGGMYDMVSSATNWEKVGMVLRHMILPVLSIFLSLIFQYVYTWRTVFLLHAEDDYVDLAKAKGLPDRALERKYILRPSMPFIVTSFAIMLVSFWQMTTALEKVFNWPGIGRLYILTLPNFLGESFYPGIMSITLSIVVLFAYILGITVLILDISYALMDPRIRIGTEEQTVRLVTIKTRKQDVDKKARKDLFAKNLPQNFLLTSIPPPLPKTKRMFFSHTKRPWKKQDGFKATIREILRYPSAIFGLTIILLLVIGSVVAVTVFPYDQIGEYWYTKALTGKTYVPKLAQPSWVNWFRKVPLPSTMIWNSQENPGLITAQSTSESGNSTTFTFNIDYTYGDFPQNLILYFHDKYDAKRPFASVSWTTPDGREFDIATTDTTQPVDFSTDIKITRLLAQNPSWKQWFNTSGNYPSSDFVLLFADPSKDDAAVLKGNYVLQVNAQTFEKNSDVDVELVLLGQIYGYAGTDYMRRDLIVPLLWGMPFALIFGLLGAFVTTVLSMAIAATGVWFGGWVDQLIQRLVEANMVLPVIAISVLIYSYFNASIWTILGIIVILNVFGSPIKSFRSALLHLKDSPYIEAAKSYGANNFRIITRYLIPSILPVLIPQLVTLIPSYVFLEATLGIFNVRSDYPTWGRIIYDALRYGGNWGSPFWVLEPIGLLLLTGLAFTMLGFALERILNPKLRTK
jgi:peptide/nickel transport system permease protein